MSKLGYDANAQEYTLLHCAESIGHDNTYILYFRILEEHTCNNTFQAEI